jgi:CspA family cold shock protein
MASTSSEPTGQTLEGVVRWYSMAKGYGFVVHPETGEDIFIHYSEIQGADEEPPEPGDRLRFELMRSEKGLSGRFVERLG